MTAWRHDLNTHRDLGFMEHAIRSSHRVRQETAISTRRPAAVTERLDLGGKPYYHCYTIIESGPLWRGRRCVSANLAMSDHLLRAIGADQPTSGSKLFLSSPQGRSELLWRT